MKPASPSMVKEGLEVPLLQDEQQLSPSQAHTSQLVLLPDISAPAHAWQRQRFLMAVWLCSSIMALLVMAPMASAKRWSLVADSSVIAAALGIMGSVLHLRERELAANNILELGAQLKLVSTCGIIAAALDAFILLANTALLVNAACLPWAPTCFAATRTHWMFVAYFLHHGILSAVVAGKADSLMPSIQLVQYELV